MTRLPPRAAALLGAISLTAMTLSAQSAPARSSSSGVFLGFGAEWNNIAPNPGGGSSTHQEGSGRGVVLGYGFSEHWALYVEGGMGPFRTSGGNITSVGSAGIGARYHIGSGPHRTVPFVEFGVSQRALSQDYTTSKGTQSLFGGSFLASFGAGMNLHLHPALALSGSALWSAGQLPAYDRDNLTFTGRALRVTQPQLHLGFIVFPAALPR